MEKSNVRKGKRFERNDGRKGREGKTEGGGRKGIE